MSVDRRRGRATAAGGRQAAFRCGPSLGRRRRLVCHTTSSLSGLCGRSTSGRTAVSKRGLCSTGRACTGRGLVIGSRSQVILYGRRCAGARAAAADFLIISHSICSAAGRARILTASLGSRPGPGKRSKGFR